MNTQTIYQYNGLISYCAMLFNPIIMPKAIIGTIIDVGPGKWNEAGTARVPMSFKVGDRVLLPQVGITKLEWDGIEYLATSEATVLGLIEEQN